MARVSDETVQIGRKLQLVSQSAAASGHQQDHPREKESWRSTFVDRQPTTQSQQDAKLSLSA
jgi:hypothetical protein